MKKISIVFFSGSGHTRLMAEAVQRGAASVAGTEAELLQLVGSDITEGRWKNESVLQKIAASDAVIFGTPTYMGGPAAQFKAFADASGMVWFQQGWRNKLAGGFTHSGSPSGDKLSTLQYLADLAFQHGMLWVGLGGIPSMYFGQTDGFNRLGFYHGAAGATPFVPGAAPSVDSGDLLTAERYGQRIATLAASYTPPAAS
jgi:NAD(P)H dehydrogenase (quinone)